MYQEAGQPEAYRRSLSIEVRLGNVAGQAGTLGQLGNLYDDVLGRPEEAVAFHRQAADKYVELGDAANEGKARNNLGRAMRKLRRLYEAQQEVLRVIECKEQFGHAAEPWAAWALFAEIETDAGAAAAAAAAKHKVIALYFAYRRDGGENHNPTGRICLAAMERLRTGESAAASSLLQELASNPGTTGPLRTFIQALQAIVAGSRDRTLADAPDLDHTMAAEILFLLDELEKAGK